MVTLEGISSNKGLSEALAWPLDFNVNDLNEDHVWFKIAPNEPYSIIATDGAGGYFLKIKSRGSIYYISSEGQAGCVGQSLEHFLSILIEVPYWQDLCHFSGDGNLVEMKKTAIHLASTYENDCPEVLAAVKVVRTNLQLDTIRNPISELCQCLKNTSYKFLAPDGYECTPLFGSYTIEQMIK